jgi:hypothetical protein
MIPLNNMTIIVDLTPVMDLSAFELVISLTPQCPYEATNN